MKVSVRGQYDAYGLGVGWKLEGDTLHLLVCTREDMNRYPNYARATENQESVFEVKT